MKAAGAEAVVYLPVTVDELAAHIPAAIMSSRSIVDSGGASDAEAAQAIAAALFAAIIAARPKREQKPMVVTTHARAGFGGSTSYRWRMKGANHEITSSGEGHTRSADARRAALRVIRAPKVLREGGGS